MLCASDPGVSDPGFFNKIECAGPGKKTAPSFFFEGFSLNFHRSEKASEPMR